MSEQPGQRPGEQDQAQGDVVDVRDLPAHATPADLVAHRERMRAEAAERAAHPTPPRPVVVRHTGAWRRGGAMAAAMERVAHLSPEEIEAERIEDEERAREETRAVARQTSYLGYAETRPDRYVMASYAALQPQQDPRGLVTGWWRSGSRTLVLAGPPSHGKTHAAYAIANEVAADARDGRTAPVSVRAVRAVDLRDLFGVVPAHAARDEVAARVRARTVADLHECDLLLLDDLTAARTTDFVREQFYKLVDARVTTNGLRTIITANARVDTELGAALEQAVGAAITARLRDGAYAAWIEGQPMRQFDRVAF